MINEKLRCMSMRKKHGTVTQKPNVMLISSHLSCMTTSRFGMCVCVCVWRTNRIAKNNNSSRWQRTRFRQIRERRAINFGAPQHSLCVAIKLLSCRSKITPSKKKTGQVLVAYCHKKCHFANCNTIVKRTGFYIVAWANSHHGCQLLSMYIVCSLCHLHKLTHLF